VNWKVALLTMLSSIGVAVFASTAAAGKAQAAGATLSCKGGVQLGIIAPITGAAASIGSDQLHWAEFFKTRWNESHKLKVKLVQEDSQLDPSKASLVAQQLASDSGVVGTVGPAGSDEVAAAASVLKKAHLPFISPSATNVALTKGTYRGYFFRDVPNDSVQGPTDARFILGSMGVKRGQRVMVVDDEELYSTGLAGIVQRILRAHGIKVDRESISEKDTDFSALVAKVSSSTKAIFTPFHLASQAQLIAQQLRAQGKKTPILGSDGTFDQKNFNVPGNYISFFAPDVQTIRADRKVVRAFHRQFPGASSPFGAPAYVAMQVLATAASRVCSHGGKISRDALRKQVAKTALRSTILGQPVKFTKKGDLAHARFHIFAIRKGGKYVTIK
jgi:branched-chain amino acid transport system substrate-binding protein